ncbi:MAG: protein O-mannosyl-transferase family [Candidatus Krumholzibacteriia bacterium]
MANENGKGRPGRADGPPAGTIQPDKRGPLLFKIGAALTFLASLVVFMKTMAPSASFWDSGEFIAASYTLGIPHSPGTPLYVLLGRVFTLMPLPLSVAGKVNFISVVSGAAGAMFVYVLVVRFLDHVLGRSATLGDSVVKIVAGLVGGLFIAFSQTFWTNATEAEVYSLSAFLMGFMTWLGLKWADNPTGAKSTSFIYLLFYLLALSVGFHLGTILAFSGIFFLILMTRDKGFSNWQFLLACFGVAILVADATLYREGGVTLALLIVFALALAYTNLSSRSRFAAVCTGLFILGISVHIYLYIRSGHNPFIDEADPETWDNLYAVLRREQYPPPNVLARKASFGFQLQHFNDYFQNQFQILSFYIGKLNAGSVVPLALGVWGMVDHYAKHKKTFIMLFATLIVVSVGMIVYLNFSDAEVRERDYFYSPAFYYFAVFIGIGVGSLLTELKKFVRLRQLSVTAPVAIASMVFVALPILTARNHAHTHDRSDDYVCREYAKNMLVGLEPNSVIFTNGDNDTFPLWYIQEVEKYRTDVRVVNLSLLNTPWYLRQLRDNEPRLSIQWTDEELDRLRPIRTEDGWVLVRDQGVYHILQNVSRNRPIYFAVTIPPDIYTPYREIIEMEGLAYRVVPKKGKNMINAAKLEDNIWNKFSWQGLLDENWKRDESTYQPPFVHRLVQNYAAAFTQLGFIKGQDDDCAGAVKNLEVAQEISPNLDPVANWLGWYYLECGDTAKAITYYDEQVARRPERVDLLYRQAGIYERIDDLPSAINVLDRLIRRDPDHRDAVLSIVGMLMRFNETPRAVNYVENWLARHPNDDALRKALESLRNPAAQTTEPAPDGR